MSFAGGEGDFELQVWNAFAQIPAFFHNMLDKHSRGDSESATLTESIQMMKRQWEKTADLHFPLTIGSPIEPTDTFTQCCYKQGCREDELQACWTQIFQPPQKNDYYALLKGWKEQGECIQPKEITEGICMIEKDVVRIEQSSEEGSIQGIRDILITWLHQDYYSSCSIGYAQGMTDICWVFWNVFEGESSLAFDAFCGWMAQRGAYFVKDSPAMRYDLSVVRKLLQITQPSLYELLEQRGSLSMFFAYRWLVLAFRREFPIRPDLLRLWEVLFCNPFTQKYHLFVVLAILERYSEQLQAEMQCEQPEAQMEGVAKFFSECTFEVGDLVQRAEKIWLRWERVYFLASDEDLVQLKRWDL